ncbi:uncharacterized protein LOC111683162 [Lucilia cuprina]|uniref:uncharacterized protein LOC111683162 n=1 Tax=Lucilia cuprina TaxID=7375 RepID=UPI001F062BD0|nr:uncharacterized protein LOC111683162 [Lucilia cuprina]
MYYHTWYYVTIGLFINGFGFKGLQAEQHPATADEGPLSEVQTAVGLEVALPCDLMPGTMIADKVQLVIWYRQGNVKPIYTFDARGRSLHQGIPWADENVFKNKAHFYYDSNPPALRIKNIQISDAGLYKCRVDFHKSPTRNWRINVTVLVPPTQLTILDHQGAAVRDQTAGPYLEGDSINLTCLSSGGIPPPRVSWWREHALVDDSFQVLPDGTVRNVLHLKNISRKDLLTVYTCQASNGHVVAALTKKVILDMNLPPLSLLLQGLNHALVAGTRTHVTCTAVGARPAPQIIWSKGGQQIKGATQSTSSDGNTTVSELILIPVPEDNERQVQCSISLNPSMTSQHLPEGHTTITTVMANGNTGLFLKDSRVLNVTHAPIVSLSLGAPLDPNNLLKGSDVYLECEVKANPGITKVEWYHNVILLFENFNISNMKFLIVVLAALALAAPTLATTYNRCSLAKAMYNLGVPKDQLARWTCIAEHESSYRTGVVGPTNSNGSNDYGIFQINNYYWCQPSNGRFSYNEYSFLKFTDLPDAIKNCTAYNATANSMQIQCIPGYDGGIPQHFHVQVYDELNRQILYNTSFRNPEFTVKRLPSDSVFVIRITAVNAQGASKISYRVRGRTLSAPLLRTASSTAVLVQLTPLLGALVGVIATLVLVAICIVIFMKFRTKHTRRGPNGDTTTTEADKGSAEPLSRNMGSHSSLEDKNPDVIPQETNSEDEFHLEEKAFDRLNMESQRILYTPTSRINTQSPPPPSLSPTFGKQYGELSLTTNPAFSLYNTPQRAPATQRPVYTAPPPLLSTRTPPNIYTRIPGRTYLPAYETRTSPTSPYGSTTTCTMPLLGGQSNGSLQTNSSTGTGMIGSMSGVGGVGGNSIGSSGGGGSLSLTSGNTMGHCNTLPHPNTQHQHQNPISTALTSSLTSGNITIGAAQSLLTSPRTHSAYSNSTTTTIQSPLLATSTLLGNGNYETISS